MSTLEKAKRKLSHLINTNSLAREYIDLLENPEDNSIYLCSDFTDSEALKEIIDRSFEDQGVSEEPIRLLEESLKLGLEGYKENCISVEDLDDREYWEVYMLALECSCPLTKIAIVADDPGDDIANNLDTPRMLIEILYNIQTDTSKKYLTSLEQSHIFREAIRCSARIYVL